jgi:hypothetical protein
MSKIKPIFAFVLVMAIAGICYAQGASGRVYHEVQIVDELNRPVTSITSVTVRLPSTTSAATIYMDRAGNNAITQPMTTASTNTTLSSGSFYWWGPDGWDYTVTDGTNTATNYGHASMTSSSGQIVFPSYLAAISSTTYTDGQSATFGTDSDFVLNGGTVANRFTVTPAATDESAVFWFGADTTGVDVEMFAATTGDYVLWDASDEQLEFVGTAILLDDDSDLDLGSGKDFVIDCDTTATLDVTPLATDESPIVNLGANTSGIDLKLYAATTGDYVLWDASAEELYFEDALLVLNEGSDLIFRDSGDATDWLIECDSAERLEFLPTETTDDQVFAVGDADHTSDLLWYTKTASSILTIDASADLMFLDGIDLRINDDDMLLFGDSSEFTVDYDETTTDNLIVVAANANDAVQIGDGTTGTDFKCISTGDADAFVLFDASGDTNNGQMLFGADNHGIDVVFYGASASQKAWWDQSADTWYYGADAEGVDVYFYADTTGDYVMWNEDSAAEALTFVDVNAVLDNGSYVLDMGTSGTKTLVGTPVLIEFRPTAGETLTFKVPSQVDLLIADAWGHKIAAAGSGANDDLTLQNNDGSAAAIYDTEELDSIADKARIQFDNLDDSEAEIEGGDILQLVAQEASSCDSIVYVSGIYKTAD